MKALQGLVGFILSICWLYLQADSTKPSVRTTDAWFGLPSTTGPFPLLEVPSLVWITDRMSPDQSNFQHPIASYFRWTSLRQHETTAIRSFYWMVPRVFKWSKCASSRKPMNCDGERVYTFWWHALLQRYVRWRRMELPVKVLSLKKCLVLRIVNNMHTFSFYGVLE